MPGPTPSVLEMPGWPRLLSEEMAAAYVGVSPNTFRAYVGNPWPKAIRFGRRKLYDRVALDRAVDRLSTPERQSPGDRIRRGREHDSGGSFETR